MSLFPSEFWWDAGSERAARCEGSVASTPDLRKLNSFRTMASKYSCE
jgi:hypothetical protein